jgi:hypothetical protein
MPRINELVIKAKQIIRILIVFNSLHQYFWKYNVKLRLTAIDWSRSGVIGYDSQPAGGSPAFAL